MVRCPTCAAEVQPDWDWCHACGWDPEGLRPMAGDAPPPPPSAPAPAPARGRSQAGPGRVAGPTGAVAASDPAPAAHDRRGPVRPDRSSNVGIVVLGAGGAIVALVAVVVVAMTLVGTSSDAPAFSSVDGAIAAPDDGPPPIGALGDVDGGEDLPDDAEWIRYTAADGSYSVDFPVQPAVQLLPTDEPTIARAESIDASVGSVGYGILLFEYEPEFPIQNPPAALELTTDEILPRLGMTITDTVAGTYASSPSLSFTGHAGSGEAIDGVAFIAGQRLYVLAATSAPGANADPARFLDSFALG